MYLTHTFSDPQTLSLAHSWLTRLGFHPRKISNHKSSVPRLMIPVAPQSLAAAHMLINAAESADAGAFPSHWDASGSPQGSGSPRHQDDAGAGGRSREPRSSVIGWHPID